MTDFVNSDVLQGFRITIDHVTLGTLFACVLDATGSIITDSEEGIRKELPVSEILAELTRFGFFVTYEPESDLSGDQLDYLMTLKGLGYDKIRVLVVQPEPGSTKQEGPKVVAFQANPLGDWLNNGYSPTRKEFLDALVAGTATNLTEMSRVRHLRWDWLDYVGSIDDILRDNLGNTNLPSVEVEDVYDGE